MMRWHDLIFVYGTLRLGYDGAMTRCLHAGARHIGKAQAHGLLYVIADYPGLVAGQGQVTGDLFQLHDPAAMLALLDDYEECSPAYPTPHEYERRLIMVRTSAGPVEAWAYLYMRDVGELSPIPDGDFMRLR